MKPKPSGYWTKERCLKSALKYINTKEWNASESVAYQIAHKRGWGDECKAHMSKTPRKTKWTKEACMADAALFNTKVEWRKNGKASARTQAGKNGWLDECCAHMNPLHKTWTLEALKEDALKYKTRSSWGKSSSGYAIAVNRGVLDECCEHMIALIKPDGYWTKERVIDEANIHSNWSDFAGSSAYRIAERDGFVAEVKAAFTGDFHMKRLGYDLDDLINEVNNYATWTEFHASGAGSMARQMGSEAVAQCRAAFTGEITKKGMNH
jgi:hypothetical protein